MSYPQRREIRQENRAMNISNAVIEALAEETKADPLSFEPLYNVIDTEALDMLFATMYDGRTRPGGEISFRLDGYHIVVTVERGVANVDINTVSE